MNEAISFVRATLQNGPVLAKEVQQLAYAANIASVTLQRAKTALNVQSNKRKGEFTDVCRFLPSKSHRYQ